MSGYTVISSDMPRTSSINTLPTHVRWAWLYLITIQRDGVVEGITPSTLALGCHITAEQARHAIEELTSPDEGSKNRDHDGRRMVQNEPGCYTLVAYEDYSNLIKKVTATKRKQKQRAKERDDQLKTENVPAFEKFWETYPRHKGTSKADARKAYAKALSRGILPVQLNEAAATMAANVKATNTEERYIPHASTWLNQDRYETWLEVKRKADDVKWIY